MIIVWTSDRQKSGKAWRGRGDLVSTHAHGLQVYKGLRSGVQDVAVKKLTIPEELEMQAFWVEINLLRSLSYDRNIVQVLTPLHPILLYSLINLQ